MEPALDERVCIIGAGIAGLVAAKVLAGDGFDVAVFEKEPWIGGVWAPSRTYPGLRTNNPRETYAFSDFPYAKGTDAFPTAEQVRSYLESYVDHFGIRRGIRLATEVLSVSHRPGGPGFRVVVRRNGGPSPRETCDFGFVVVCNGVFSQPYVPRMAGEADFSGVVLHSSNLAELSVVEGKRVVVVGAGKSALDCATVAARGASSCTLLFRAPHWMVPRYFFGLLRMDHLLLTRFSELFLRYCRPTRFEAFLHGPGKPLVRLFWGVQNWLLPRVLGMPDALVPEIALPMGFESVGVGDEFYAALGRERIVPKRAGLAAFEDGRTLALDTGERIDADVVVFATGWRQDLPFLDAELRRHVLMDGEFHLYRHILPPEEPRLGFVGYASSIACQFTSEIAAHWLSQHFRGELRLPAVPEMDRAIAEVRQWSSRVFPARDEGYFIGPYIAHYTDELMRDMGLREQRAKNPLSEYFGRFLPSRYRDVAEERRRARGATQPQQDRFREPSRRSLSRSAGSPPGSSQGCID